MQTFCVRHGSDVSYTGPESKCFRLRTLDPAERDNHSPSLLKNEVKVASDGITKIPTNREQARFSQEAVVVCQPDPVHGKINIIAGC